jgi:hypothetical protein
MRSETTRELLRDHKAFTLLAGIAYRAKWTDGLSVHNLKPGQALIGDHRSFGLSAKEYRTAKARLEKYRLAAFQGTNKGTVATLLNADVFDIFGDSRGEQEGNPRASQGRTRGNPRASNEDGRRREKTEKPKEGIRRIEIRDYGDIKDPAHDPIALALSVTRERAGGREEGFYRKALKVVGEEAFREGVSALWGELKCDDIRNPGAILTNKLKRRMGTSA